jgi:hypothetical protein
MRRILLTGPEMCSNKKLSARMRGSNIEVKDGLAAESRVRAATGVEGYLLRSLGSYMPGGHRSFISPMRFGEWTETTVVCTYVCDVSLVH